MINIDTLAQIVFESNDKLSDGYAHVMAKLGPMGVVLAHEAAEACRDHALWTINKLAPIFELDPTALKTKVQELINAQADAIKARWEAEDAGRN